jgi:hypothetical protein
MGRNTKDFHSGSGKGDFSIDDFRSDYIMGPHHESQLLQEAGERGMSLNKYLTEKALEE